ncbi:MAG: hypothetical protein ABJB12_04595 [Pseudomonadota bacterium]
MTLSINGKFSIAVCLALFPACGGSQPTNAGSGGGTASAGSNATAGTSGGGSGGTASSAGSASTANASGGSGGSSLAGSAGAGGSGGASGAASGGSGGNAGSGGTAGASGASGGGSSAGASGAGGLLAIASSFDKFRFECPCIDANHFGLDKPENCDNAASVDRQTFSKKLAGDANVVYDVKLHVRGDTEPNTYVLGKLDPNMRFYVGGETSTAGYTAYMLTVADPPQVYFFNYNPSTSHIHFKIDYEVSIPMRGGTALKFEVNGGKSVPDGHGVSNRDQLVVPGIAPDPDPYNGQLVQFDVVSVDPRP